MANIIRKIILLSLVVFFLAASAKSQSQWLYRSFNPTVDACNDASKDLIFQMNPSFSMGAYHCAANAYVAVDLTASGGGSPGGINTSIQFNDAGIFGGVNGFTFDKATNILTNTGPLVFVGNSSSPGPSISKSANGLLLSGGASLGVRINNQSNTTELFKVDNTGNLTSLGTASLFGGLINFGGAAPSGLFSIDNTGTINSYQGGTFSNGQLLIGSVGTGLVPANLTAGANITITNTPGHISIAAGGGGSPGGLSGNVQFNNAGIFGGNTSFNFDNTNGALLIPDGSAAHPGLAFNSATNTGIYNFGTLIFSDAGIKTLNIEQNNTRLNSNTCFGWASGNAESSADVKFCRNVATIVKVTNIIQVTPLTVATLPTCNGSTEGAFSSVTDGLAPAFLTIIVGGGTVHTPVFCNGTNWIAH